MFLRLLSPCCGQGSMPRRLSDFSLSASPRSNPVLSTSEGSSPALLTTYRVLIISCLWDALWPLCVYPHPGSRPFQTVIDRGRCDLPLWGSYWFQWTIYSLACRAYDWWNSHIICLCHCAWCEILGEKQVAQIHLWAWVPSLVTELPWDSAFEWNVIHNSLPGMETSTSYAWVTQPTGQCTQMWWSWVLLISVMNVIHQRKSVSMGSIIPYFQHDAGVGICGRRMAPSALNEWVKEQAQDSENWF